MSIEAKAAVELILKNCEVTFAAIPKGEKIRDGWKCDEWSVSFTVRDGRAAHEEFEYFTGIGHRSKIDATAMGRMTAQSLKGSHPNSLAWEQARKAYCKPVAPHPADVLHSLLLDSIAVGQSFASWCDELGMDSDSRKAYATYEACQVNADKLARVFDRVAREALQNALQDY